MHRNALLRRFIMKYVYGQRIKTFRDRLTTIIASFAILANSLGAFLPFIMSDNVSAKSTVVVTPTNANGWTKVGGGESDFSSNQAKIGSGSYRFKVDTNGQKHLFNANTRNLKLSEITSLSYSSFIESRSSGTAVAPLIRIDTQLPGKNFLNQPSSVNTTLVWEPANAGAGTSTLTSQWQDWNPLTQGRWWASPKVDAFPNQDTYMSWADIVNNFPEAKTRANGVYLSAGQNTNTSAPWNNGFVGYVDNLKINTYTYDFEASLPQPPASPTGLRSTSQTGSDITGGASNINWVNNSWNNVDNAVSYNYEFRKPEGLTTYSANTTNTYIQGQFHNSSSPQGEYAFRVQAVKADNLTSEWTSWSPVSYDTTKPTATLVSPSSNISGSNLAIKVEATDNLGLSRIVANIYKDGALLKSTFTNIDGTNTGTHTANENLPAGSYTIRYNSQDKAGNISSTGNHEVNIDTNSPSIMVKGKGNTYTPLSIGNFESDIYKEVSFKLFDSNQIDKVTVNGVAKDLSNNNWSDLNNIMPGVFGAIEGENTLVVYDVAGNTSNYNFTLDTIAPATPTHISPSDNSFIAYNDFNFDWSDAEDAVEYEFQSSQNPSIDSSGALNSGVWNNKQNGGPDRNYLTQSEIHSYGANGTWYWQVRTIDSAGNKSSWTSPWSLNIDMEKPPAPTLGLYINGNPVNNGHTTNVNEVLANWNKPSSDTVTYEYEYWNDIAGNQYKEDSPWRTANNSESRLGNFTEGEGKHFIKVRAIDNAGNKSDWSNVFEINYDITPPSLTINELPESSSSTLTITGTVQGAIAVQIKINNGEYEEAVIDGNNWSYNIAEELEDGTYPISVTATDQAGNTAGPTIAQLVISTPPQTVPNPPSNQNNQPINNGVLGAITNSLAQPPVSTPSVANTTRTFRVTNDSIGTNDASSGAEVLAETDEVMDSEMNRSEVEGQLSEARALATEDQQQDDQCTKILGVCWYWWIPVVAVVILVAYFVGRGKPRD